VGKGTSGLERARPRKRETARATLRARRCTIARNVPNRITLKQKKRTIYNIIFIGHERLWPAGQGSDRAGAPKWNKTRARFDLLLKMIIYIYIINNDRRYGTPIEEINARMTELHSVIAAK